MHLVITRFTQSSGFRTLFSEKLFIGEKVRSRLDGRHTLCRSNTRSMAVFRKRPPVVPPTVAYALNIFKTSHLKYDQNVQKLLKVYSAVEAKHYAFIEGGAMKRHPLIILEGLDGCGKTAVGKKVARKIRGVYRSSPSKSISDIRRYFEDAALKYRASYYTVGNYIVAMEIYPDLTKAPVILDRYWHSTNAFHIAMAVQDNVFFPMPAPGNKIFSWPKDLLRPDICLFLHVDEHIRVQRHCNRGTTNTNQEKLLETNARFRNNVLEAYGRMFNPGLIKVNANPAMDKVVQEIEDKIKYILMEAKLARKEA